MSNKKSYIQSDILPPIYNRVVVKSRKVVEKLPIRKWHFEIIKLLKVLNELVPILYRQTPITFNNGLTIQSLNDSLLQIMYCLVYKINQYQLQIVDLLGFNYLARIKYRYQYIYFVINWLNWEHPVREWHTSISCCVAIENQLNMGGAKFRDDIWIHIFLRHWAISQSEPLGFNCVIPRKYSNCRWSRFAFQ